MSETHVSHTKPRSKMRSLSKSRGGVEGDNSVVIVESAIEARFRRRSTHVPNLTGQRLKQKRQIATQPVALYDAGAAGDSYGAPLKCRT